MISTRAASFTSALAATCTPPRLELETSSFDMIVELGWCVFVVGEEGAEPRPIDDLRDRIGAAGEPRRATHRRQT